MPVTGKASRSLLNCSTEEITLYLKSKFTTYPSMVPTKIELRAVEQRARGMPR